MSNQLEQIIAKLREGQQLQTAAWQEVQQFGRQYAQMTLHGSYLENGRCVTVCHSDRKRYAEHYRDEMLRACERAFLEDALMGAAVARSLPQPT